jgi:cytochrome c553
MNRLLITVLAAVSIAQAAGADQEGIAFFESRVRPALAKYCYECHSAESGKTKGGLRVDTREALLKGGESGPAVVPRSLEKSVLFQAITSKDKDAQMPPKGRLPDAVIADLRRWIEMGAPDPRAAQTVASVPVKTAVDVEKGRSFWAYQPLTKPSPPVVSGAAWARTDIVRFVQAGLEAKRLKPVGDADAAVLVRRLFFVLFGLPPSPEAVEQWTKLISPAPGALDQKAVANLVDALLRTPHYGEHWGRHWLDVARFAESTGGDRNNITMHAWRYRDYVIDAFNADKPFDQFIREQIAGDLLPPAGNAQKAQNLIATGFLAIGAKNVGEEDGGKFHAELVDEQIDATTRAFLATSAACARCHDHKSDPIPQADYYALAAIFRGTDTRYGLIKAQSRHTTALLDLTGMGPPPAMPPASKQKLAELTKARDDAAKAVEDAMKAIRSGENVFRGKFRKLRSDREETAAALDAFGKDGTTRVLAMGVQASATAPVTRLLVRGEPDKPAQVVAPAVLQVLAPRGGSGIPARAKGGGRLQLAEWIASPRNPLTARVVANRVWHWMFGQGLVRTVDDFGATGEAPSHPELLDFLAARLIENQWSIKALIREIALSRAWQLSSEFSEAQFAADPDNRLLWRADKRRLDAESMRDSVLWVSGQLDRSRPLGTLLVEAGEGGVGQNVFEPVIRGLDSNHRSVYLPRVRNLMPEMLDLFDAPDASMVSGSRSTTSSPLQALFMMNNTSLAKQSAAFADRIAAQAGPRQIEFAWMAALGRPPTARERELAAKFLQTSGRQDRALAPLAQSLFCTAEFSTID